MLQSGCSTGKSLDRQEIDSSFRFCSVNKWNYLPHEKHKAVRVVVKPMHIAKEEECTPYSSHVWRRFETASKSMPAHSHLKKRYYVRSMASAWRFITSRVSNACDVHSCISSEAFLSPESSCFIPSSIFTYTIDDENDIFEKKPNKYWLKGWKYIFPVPVSADEKLLQKNVFLFSKNRGEGIWIIMRN